MSGNQLKWLLSAPLAIALLLCTLGTASAAVDKVICVPWQGDAAKQHTALSGVAVQLKGVVKTTDATPVYYKWVFGDGSESAVTTLSGGTKYNVATTHSYTAASGTPFTAILQLSNTTPFSLVKEDTYLLKIEDNTQDAQINISIDKGLWWLYTNAYSNNPVYGTNYSSWIQTYNGSTAMAWLQTSYVGTLASPTASSVHAFGVNGHKINGNSDQDPYVDAVKFGMNYLTNGYRYNSTWPALQTLSIGPLTRSNGAVDNPDGNGNGFGIQVYDGSDHQPYQGGQIMDAIIASGALPTDLTGRDFAPGTAKSHNWTYGELLQDMADMYSWGQWDGVGCVAATATNPGICGSWWYNWNYSSPGDNSASQWGAIGLLPAQQSPWNVIVPQWVKDYNANWLAYNMGGYNYFSYTSPGYCAGDSCLQTTTSGMVQMIFDGQTIADPKWDKAEKYVADRWQNFLFGGSTWGGYKTYGWYSFAKAMRLSLPTATTQLVKTSGATFDWYYGDSTISTCSNETNCEKGLAPRIIEIQAADGSWPSGNLSNTPLTTAWMIITLKPTLFESSPIACYNAAPNPSYADQPIAFDPACSGHSESGKGIANLTKFEWDWDNDGTYDASSGTPDVQSHSFSCAVLPCTYPVKLMVTDDSNPPRNATSIININITNPPHPPFAITGGPYVTSMCSTDSLILNGSNSFDQDEGEHEAGCSTCPNDTITAWDWDLKAPLTFDAINATGKTPTVSAADITSFFGVGTHNLGLRVTDNTKLAYPNSGQNNLIHTAFGSVDVKDKCLCTLTARAKTGMVQLNWAVAEHTATTAYDIYRSTAGPNTGFTKIRSGYVNKYALFLDSGLVNGTTYYYRVEKVLAAGGTCGSKAVSGKPMGLF